MSTVIKNEIEYTSDIVVDHPVVSFTHILISGDEVDRFAKDHAESNGYFFDLGNKYLNHQIVFFDLPNNHFLYWNSDERNRFNILDLPNVELEDLNVTL